MLNFIQSLINEKKVIKSVTAFHYISFKEILLSVPTLYKQKLGNLFIQSFKLKSTVAKTESIILITKYGKVKNGKVM